jgi:hypothetical protein
VANEVGGAANDAALAANLAAQKAKEAFKSGKLPYPGCGRNFERFRFWDLFYALQAAFDLRKVVAHGLGFLGGTIIMTLLGILGGLIGVGWLNTIFGIIGMLGFLASVSIFSGIATAQSHAEMLARKKLPMSEGINFVKSRFGVVLGTPFFFLILMLGVGAGMGVLAGIARIPYFGPIFYGLTFMVTMILGMAMVVIGFAWFLALFSYVPAAGSMGLSQLTKHMFSLIAKNTGRFFGHFAIANLVASFLWVLVNGIFSLSFLPIMGVGVQAGGANVMMTLMGLPKVLFGMLAPLMMGPVGKILRRAGGVSWEYDVGGWLAGIFLLLVVCLLVGIVFSYWFSAGVVNYHLLTQDEEQDAAGPYRSA